MINQLDIEICQNKTDQIYTVDVPNFGEAEPNRKVYNNMIKRSS